MGNDQQALLIHAHLHVVVLVEAVVRAVLHDPRLRVGEVVLLLVSWPRCGGLGCPSTGLASPFPCLFLPCTQLGLVLGFLRRVSFLRARFQDPLRLCQVDQSSLPKGDLGFDVQPCRPFALVRLCTQGHQLLYFGAQLCFQFQQTTIADRVALRGISMDLAPIQTDVPQLQNPGLLGDDQHLYEYGYDVREEGLAKGGDRVMVWMQSAGDEAEGNRLVGRFLDLARAEYPCRVTEQQQPQQDFWRKRLTPYRGIVGIESTQIQESNDRNDETCQVIRRQAVIDRDPLLPGLLIVNGFEPARHMQPSQSSIHRMSRGTRAVGHTFSSEGKCLFNRLLEPVMRFRPQSVV